MITGMTESPSSSLELVSNVARRRILAPSEDTCMICDLPTRDRRDIEEMMACGVSEGNVERAVASKTGVTLDAKTISQHLEHLPARYFTYREIIQDAAKSAGVSLESDDSITPMGYLKSVLNDAMHTLVNNPNTTNQATGIMAAKTIMDAEAARESNEDVVRWVSAFRSLLDAVRVVCTPEQVRRITEMTKDTMR